MIETGQKWLKVVKNGQNWLEVVKISRLKVVENG